MGSFNRNCGLTDLPIYRREEVYKIYLRKKVVPGYDIEEKDLYCYADDLYTPVSSLIPGIYNDYGDIEPTIEGPVLIGDFYEFDKDKAPNMLIRKDAFDSLEKFYLDGVKEGKIDEWSFDTDGQLRLDKAVPQFIKKYKEISPDDYSNDDEKLDKAIELSTLQSERLFCAPNDDSFFGSAIGSSSRNIIYFTDDGGDPDDIARIFRLWKILETLGRKFEVVQGGRQREELDLFRKLHEVSLESLNSIEKWMDEDYGLGDYDDEEDSD